MLSSDRIRGPTRFGKGLNLIFPQLSSQNMRGFDHATIFSPSFHGLRKERLAQWPPFCVLNTTKNSGGYLQKNWLWVCSTLPETLWFSLPYFRPDPKFDTLFQTWSPGARRVSPQVSLSVFSLIPDLFFDYSRVLGYAKIRTVLQSRLFRTCSTAKVTKHQTQRDKILKNGCEPP